MFGKKRSQPSGGASDGGKRKGAELMNQMGFGAMPQLEDIDAMVYGDDDDDEDLEAELAALAGEDGDPPPVKTKPKKRAPMPVSDIEQMAAMGMRDVDEDVSDTEDPDLLAELEDLAEDDVSASVSEQQPQKPHQPAPASHQQIPAPRHPPPQLAPAFHPTLPSPSSTPSPAPAPRSLPSPQKTVTPAPRPSPTPSPKPAAAAAASSGAGGMVGLLEERVNMYKQALANAKTSGDSSKQRRLDRGIKTLAGLLRQAKAGKPVIEDDIPPPVAMGASQSAQGAGGGSTPQSDSSSSPSDGPSSSGGQNQSPLPSTSSATPVPQSSPSTSKSGPSGVSIAALEERRDQYKKAAQLAKRGGDMEKAKEYVKIAMQFDNVLHAIVDGKEIDLSHMPPPPPQFAGQALNAVNKPQPSVPVQRTTHQAAGESEPDIPQTTAEEEKKIFNAPENPRTVMEALTQRLEKYKSTEAAAKAAGDGSKARRMGRITKQYEDAIKSYKGGRPVDFDDLPVPPGYGPIPKDSGPPAKPPQQQPATSPSPSGGAAAPSPRAAAPTAPSPQGQARPPAPTPRQAAGHPTAPKAPIQRQNTARKSMSSRTEQQLAFLKERYEEFGKAALAAKKKHDLEMAKKYVQMRKGLEPMMEALECGLPVDLSQVPPSPFNTDEDEDKFVVVSAEDCTPTGDREEVYKNLQADLLKQIRMCVTNAQHYQKLGDIPAAARFEKLEQSNRRDLESLKSAYRHGDPAPRFHYETKTFSTVICNTDLGDADLELSVIRGIQYNLPSGYHEKDMDTCIKYELAFPTDEPQSGGTGTVKDTVNPEYNETFKLSINRKSKGLLRFMERKGLKLEVYIKRGFFKGDKLLGTVTVKLQPLETVCTIHESYDLMDGRKSVGGKLEVKLRIREPLKTKQVEEVKEKWLIIDQFIRTAGSKSQAEAKTPRTQHGEGTSCMEVLRYEKQMLDKQIIQLKDSLSVTQSQALKHKSALLEEKLELQQKKLREGGTEAWKAHLTTVKKEVLNYDHEARQFTKLGEVQKAELMMTKRKLAEKEIAAIQAKIPGT